MKRPSPLALDAALALIEELLEVLQAAEMYVAEADAREKAANRAAGHGTHLRVTTTVLSNIHTAIAKAERVA